MQSVKTRILTNVGLTILTGLLLLIFPGAAFGAAATLIGILVLGSGLVDIWRYLSKNAYAYFVRGSLFTGLLKILLGLFMLTHIGSMAEIFTYVFSIFLITGSIANLETSLLMYRSGIRSAMTTVILSIAIVVLGIVFLFYPITAAMTIVRLMGVIILVQGITEILIYHQAKKVGGKVMRTMKEVNDELNGNIIDMDDFK